MMKKFAPILAASLLAVVAVSVGACAGSSTSGNSSTPPKFSNTVPDREQGRNSRGATPQETGQSQDVTNNRR